MIKMAWSSTELVNMYNYLSSGHFFDKDTMRFFRSRVTSNFRRVNDYTALFITTEQAPNRPRRATVRLAKLVEFTRESDNRQCQRIEIETIGEFNSLSLYQAKKLMKEYHEKCLDIIFSDAIPTDR